MRLLNSRLKKIVVGLVLVTSASLWFVWVQSGRFDTAKWMDARHSVDVHRNRMADDVLRRYGLVGMSHEEIDNLLGAPTETDYFSDYDYVYWLGPHRHIFGIDSEWLCIDFENDVVVRADMRVD